MVGYKLSKNDWVTPFFVIFRSVREILLVTVFCKHPVVLKVFYSLGVDKFVMILTLHLYIHISFETSSVVDRLGTLAKNFETVIVFYPTIQLKLWPRAPQEQKLAK